MKAITIQELIISEQSILSRRITQEEIFSLLRKTEAILAKSSDKIRTKYLPELKKSLMYPNNLPLTTPDI
jgi:hypothetical protein